MASHLDYQHERSLLCQCGHPIDESHDEELKSAWIAEKRICWACAASERDRRKSTAGNKQDAPGTKRYVRNRAKD